MSQRHEFVLLADQENANIRLLCRRFGISSATAYKWLDRFRAQGAEGLQERSRRPINSPRRTAAEMEEAVVALRKKHPAWGGRTLRARLVKLGHSQVPSPSTITSILARHDMLSSEESFKHQGWKRFEHQHPNDLWQMDFKGDFALGHGRCYPLTVIDDHSRFLLGLEACSNQRTETVRSNLTDIFRRYGMPWRMAMDNGSPWARYQRGRTRFTEFSVWLIRLGIRLSFSRPHHPQSQGKVERLHRTLATELLRHHLWRTYDECQLALQHWRDQYNLLRPHQALGFEVPATRYQTSIRLFPETMPSIDYDDHELTRKVEDHGQIKYQHRRYFVGGAFAGLRVAMRPANTDGIMNIYLGHQRIATIDLSRKVEITDECV